MFNALKKRIGVISLSLITLILSSCGTEVAKTGVKRTEKVEGTPVRYLEEITCDKSNYNCYKEPVTKRIEQLCIESGFVTERPYSGVTYSRSTTEPVKGTVELVEEKIETVQTTDPNGIVTSEEVRREYVVTEEVSGYCLGTEYIVSR